jgi:hypothetical protein
MSDYHHTDQIHQEDVDVLNTLPVAKMKVEPFACGSFPPPSVQWAGFFLTLIACRLTRSSADYVNRLSEIEGDGV